MITQNGLIQLESKDEVRKRLGRSPDRADAVALAFAYKAFGGVMIGRADRAADDEGLPADERDGRWQPWAGGYQPGALERGLGGGSFDSWARGG